MRVIPATPTVPTGWGLLNRGSTYFPSTAASACLLRVGACGLTGVREGGAGGQVREFRDSTLVTTVEHEQFTCGFKLILRPASQDLFSDHVFDCYWWLSENLRV